MATAAAWKHWRPLDSSLEALLAMPDDTTQKLLDESKRLESVMEELYQGLAVPKATLQRLAEAQVGHCM